MAKLDFPYGKWREGRPRFEPNARVMALGFRGRDLRHADGRWFTFEEAQAELKRLAAEIEAARARGGRRSEAVPGAAAPVLRPSARTLEALLRDFLAACEKSVARGDLAIASLDSYRKAANAVIYRPETRSETAQRRARDAAAALLGVAAPGRGRSKETIAEIFVAALGVPELTGFFDYARDERGHHMALGMMAVISAAMTWGRKSPEWRLGPNPLTRDGDGSVKFPRPAGRIVIIEVEEFRAIVDAADGELQRPSVGDALYLGLFTGQRQIDRLALIDEGSIEGRRHFRQSKTGVFVRVKEAPALARRLAEAKARVGRIKLAKGTRPDTVVVDESTGLPYKGDTYRNWFGEARRIAARSVPSVASKRDQDLRDTAVTWMFRSGSDLVDICRITGHSPRSLQTIFDHYLGQDALRADATIDRLVAWMDREGMAV